MDLLPLLRGAEAITSLRDRESALVLAAEAIIEFLQAQRFSWFRRAETEGRSHFFRLAFLDEQGTLVTPERHSSSTSLPLDLLQTAELKEAMATGKCVHSRGAGQRQVLILPFLSNTGSLDSLLVVESLQSLKSEQQECVQRFLHFFANYLDLLDYGERDTLTGLYNRKTFDESLERLLQRDANDRSLDDRRHDDSQDPFWLAVLDIDHFKQINDTWGHLFGDETLLRFSRLLRHCFREEDQLFRFGGEEFIVIMRADSPAGVNRCFQRFQDMLAAHPFPRVETITCSIGFTRLDPSLPAVDILGHADQALYYAKSNGRNQTCFYEALVEEGLIEIRSPEDSNADLELDIDRLFGQLSQHSRY